MGFSYNKLWKKLIDNDLNKMQLKNKVGISNGSLSKLSKNKPVNMKILGKICNSLNCDISDIVEYVDFKGEKNDETKK